MLEPISLFVYVFLLFACLTGFFHLVEEKLKIPPCIAPVFVFYSILPILYVALVFDTVRVVSSLLFFAGLLLFCIFLGSKLVKKTEVKKLIRVEYIYFFSFALLLFFSCYWSHFSRWDEISSWGLYSKDLFFRGTLRDTSVWMKAYPPGVTVFQYFVCFAMGEWREGLVSWATALLMVSCLFIFFHKI